VLLFNPAHHHAQVARLDDHSHALRRNGRLNGVGNLPGQPLLHLKAAREHLHKAGILLSPMTLPLGM